VKQFVVQWVILNQWSSDWDSCRVGLPIWAKIWQGPQYQTSSKLVEWFRIWNIRTDKDGQAQRSDSAVMLCISCKGLRYTSCIVSSIKSNCGAGRYPYISLDTCSLLPIGYLRNSWLIIVSQMLKNWNEVSLCQRRLDWRRNSFLLFRGLLERVYLTPSSLCWVEGGGGRAGSGKVLMHKLIAATVGDSPVVSSNSFPLAFFCWTPSVGFND
jgi:hypothetical protein